MAVPVLFVATFIWFPESPYWLATQGRDEEAKKAIGFFKGDVDLSAELEIVKNNIGTDELKINWRDFLLLGKLRNRRALLIVMVLVLGQQFSGNFGTMQYLEKVFQQSNIGIEPHVATIIVMAVSLVFGALSTATVEKAGRRSLLIVSSFGCAVTHIVLGTYFLLEYMHVDMTSINLLPVVDVVAFAIVYQVGMGTMTNILVGELFPPSVKAIAGAIATVFDSVVGFVVMITFDPIMEHYGSKVSYLIYGTSCFVLFIFVFAYVPETKGRTFGQIQDILGTLRPFRVSSDLSCCAGPCTTRPDKPKAQEA
ncbi:facilitated trehalose transporter Tret1-like [Copidosoma floridanum]|uniref:facilitated trehalose transporter Tret1-like n=1 Tax=Copidosoma floridanum TaxID=29053 RepID=UPI000C6F56CB|nr:facilitated trehalose transporter Tret1-like [Copidosoma floridanum]